MTWELSFEPFPTTDSPLVLAHTPWDSELLGVEVYEIRVTRYDPSALRLALPGVTSTLVQRGRCMACVKLPTGHVAVTKEFTDAGFYYVETAIEQEIELAELRPLWGARPSNFFLRDAESDDLPALCEIARTGVTKDRFHLDPAIPSVKADQRMAYWVEAAWRNGDNAWLLEDGRSGGALGFFLCREGLNQTVCMSLASVRNEVKHSGVGVVLLEQSLSKLVESGSRRATARSSLNNLEIVQSLSSLGFSIRDASVTLHWHGDVAP